MAAPSEGALPPGLHLPAGYEVRVNAVSPADGSQVAGVVIQNYSLTVDDVTGGGGQGLVVGPFMLVPGPDA